MNNIFEPMDYPSDFKEFIELLNEKEVEYLIVGGYAVAHHGYPRYTGDIDVWFRATPENVLKLKNVMIAFGFESLGLNEADLMASEKVIQIGYPPIRIDLMNSIDGVEFDACYRRKVVGTTLGFPVNFISLSDLKTNKQATNRHRDLDDLEHL